MCQSNDFFPQIPFSWKGKSLFCRPLYMSLSPGAFMCLAYTQVLQEQKILSLLTPHSPLINCSLLSFKLSTSKLLSERERELSWQCVLCSAALSSMGCSLDLCMSQDCALQVICGTSHCLSSGVPKRWGLGSENAALTEVKCGNLW